MEDQEVTPMAIVAPSPDAVIGCVAEHPEAIGYVSTGSLSDTVKVLRIEGAQPSEEAVRDGKYPLARDLVLVVIGPTSEPVQSFLDFALSPAGQQIVGRRHGRIR
jgi:phosphate transport system substrate-binding protein